MDAFFDRFPGSQGTLAVSRVGVSASKDKALVYVEARQDFDAEFRPLWTWDTYFALLTRGKGGWVMNASSNTLANLKAGIAKVNVVFRS